ncbi:TetR/AcrR family transcriptional regulator [Candidatus Leptofilum sp.]|uniref:TetR/AcrR family transcriptional regulator n=1 Tax=Candidatus Leptofilum sp. TaxID=3241576 RepID=UPI003B5BF7CC
MTKSENEERRQRILDVAANLIVHYGYDKTTVSDIAREAGISKGAIYLHFDSKEALFEGLIVREMERYTAVWLSRLEADEQGGTIGSMYKNSLYAMNSSPFISALFRQDSRVFGNYVRKPGNFFQTFRQQQAESTRTVFIKMMQDAGAIRQDLDAKVVAHVMDMLAYGLVGLEEVLPKESFPPIEEVIEAIATIMNDALTLKDGNHEAGKTIVNQLVDAGRQQLETMQQE